MGTQTKRATADVVVSRGELLTVSAILKLAGPTIKRGKSVQVVATPWEFVRAAEKKFGPLAWDLAATAENAKAPNFITPEMDTFTQDWGKLLDGGLGWLNPEFDPMTVWVEYCARQQRRGAEFLVLTPASIGANWFWDYVKPFATVYSVGRMKFEGHKDPYPKDLLLNHYTQNPSHELQRWRWK
jgi:hypothetical protein